MVKIKAILFTIFILICTSHLNAQISERIVFYNCENFFDCYDEIGKNDEMFLPSSLRHWTYKRYKRKLSNFAKIISSISDTTFPPIIGLAEIENITVLNDLVNNSSLSKINYSFIHKESPDPRGIDVALLYNSEKFQVLSSIFIPVCISPKKKSYSRDILYTKGVLDKKDTLHIFVNHWSSRIGGSKKSEHKRIIQAKILEKNVDSIMCNNSNAKIIIMGDFNDNPSNKSLNEFLCNKHYNLKNLALKLSSKGIGTLKYKAYWDLFDQIIVSSSLLCSEMTIYSPSFILEEDYKYAGYKPKRTYNGMRYQGGYSDHLPVYIDVYL